MTQTQNRCENQKNRCIRKYFEMTAICGRNDFLVFAKIFYVALENWLWGEKNRCENQARSVNNIIGIFWLIFPMALANQIASIILIFRNYSSLTERF